MRFRSLAALILVATLSACDTSPEAKATGYIYFAAGSYLGKFDLSDGSSSVVANLNDANIKRVSELAGNRVLLTLATSSNNKEINHVSWIDVKTGQITNLYEGVLAVYLPGTQTYVYDDGSRLIAAARTGNFSTDAEIFRHRLFDATAIVPVSGEELLFEVGRHQERQVYRYNVLSGELIEVPGLRDTCELRDALYIPERDQLVCESVSNEGEYIFSTVAGVQRAVIETPKASRLRALLYAPKLRAIVFSEQYTTWLAGEHRSRIWLHDLGNGQNSVLSDDQSLGAASVYRAD